MRPGRLITFFACLLAACSTQAPKENTAAPAIPVLTMEVQVEDVPVYVESVGTLHPWALVDVRSQVSGILRRVYFTEGQNVHAGDPLFTIDSGVYRIKEQELEAQLMQDRAMLGAAEKKLERYYNLSNRELIPQQEWDEQNALVAKLKGGVKADEAKLAAVRLDLENCTIRAPMDGRTGKLHVHPGNLVSSSQPVPLVTLSKMDPLIVEFTLTEREYHSLTQQHLSGDSRIDICPLCKGSKSKQGTLSFFDNHFDPQSGLLIVRGKVPNEALQLLAGQSVRVRLPMTILKGVKVIGQKAVKINQHGPYVFIVGADQTVELRQVKLGHEMEEKVVVIEGVEAGDVVVSEGHLRLAPGLKVEVKNVKENP